MVILQPPLIRLALAVLAAMGGLCASVAVAAAPELALPEKVEGGFIFRFAELPGGNAGPPAHLAEVPGYIAASLSGAAGDAVSARLGLGRRR